jgi:RHS repeat-associated protein
VGYTGQRQEPELGLYYYNARWYDPYLARFTQPDTIVPNPVDAKAFDRYAYVNNNPVRYNDPSGHCVESNGQETGQGGVGYPCPDSTWKPGPTLRSSEEVTDENNSQYDERIKGMAGGDNFNACGLVALAGALYEPGSEQYFDMVERGTETNGYSAGGGIQPDEYKAWVDEELEGTHLQASASNNNTVADLKDALDAGKVVIVDISVEAGLVEPVPVGAGNNYAHFAQVLSIEENGDVILQKTLITDEETEDLTWKVTEAEFLAAWGPDVERNAYHGPDYRQPDVTNWALIVGPKE